ncbi:hypothetical protein CCY99_03640 [Helicobacter sp. 16-1353]|uniref:DUF2393 family protein n=1 Tax=Helicobacter sp. 16-1353 TaxID=2004996 RepID=UPI000DCC6A9A|nr:DUF2393 family protein [Helicobacter sp. 16-1353]RAX54452.1 hypothetical protein CCY99_03640 [Helicobacter sp. 16-1353]
MDFLQISIYDFFVFGILFIIFIAIFLLSLLLNGAFRNVLLVFCLLFFISIPFLNIFIMDNYINKVAFNLNIARKMHYTNAFILNGEITNQGKKAIESCNIYLYINKKYPLNPDFIIQINEKIAQNTSLNIDKIINDFDYNDPKSIKIRCF